MILQARSSEIALYPFVRECLNHSGSGSGYLSRSLILALAARGRAAAGYPLPSDPRTWTNRFRERAIRATPSFQQQTHQHTNARGDSQVLKVW